MKYLKKEVFFCLTVLSQLIFSSFLFTPEIDQQEHLDISPVFIIMEDDILLRVDSGNPNDLIALIEITQFAETVFVNESCNQAICISDLSVLAAGEYVINVTTTNNVLFSDSITLK